MTQRWRVPSTPAAVGRLRHAAGSFLDSGGVGAPLCFDVQLATSELVANAVVHGHRDGHAGFVEATLELAGDELHLTVFDDGVGMRPNPASPGAGLGLGLVGLLGDVEIRRPDAGGTEVLVTFAVLRENQTNRSGARSSSAASP